jgi:prophage regulatory protein
MGTSLTLIRPKALAAELGIDKSTLWRWVRDGILPSPIALGPNTRAWRREDIDRWLASREGTKQ